MFEGFRSTNRTILGYMSNQNDWFMHFFGNIHTHLSHDTYLGDTPWWAIDRWWRKHGEWINNNDCCGWSLDRSKDRIKIRLRQERNIRMTHSESDCPRTNLPDMLFSWYIEHLLGTTRVPFTHLECKCWFTNSRLSRKEYKWSSWESTTKNCIEFSWRARISLHTNSNGIRIDSFCFNYFSSSDFALSLLDSRFLECIPFPTSWTLPCPFWRSCRAWWTDKHRR